MNRTLKRNKVLLSVVMIILACLVGAPFYYIVVNTFKSQAEMSTNPLGLPHSFTLENYIKVFETSSVPQAFFNTLYVTAASVALMLLIGSMAAFAMIYRRSKLNTVIGAILLVSFLVPYQTTIIPLYQMIVGVGLVDNLTGLIAIYLAGAVFCYFLIIGYMRTVPMEILEAARIDGAGPFRIYWQIVLPLIRPVLITVGTFQVMAVWNDYISPTIFLSSPENNTLVLLASQAVSQFTTDWPSFMAVAVIVLIPMLVFFIFAQKYIVSGLVSGSVKG
ncbi:carbohydrate ABC transporter permease [Leifsonia aquatica]|uniref:carbohydrate ABC transporter permease n=1 Tax=Leifsonia aquatica TaxID=144185 RepID=UPI000468977E|nr:carbohydrate ABC transporter permease [Leifsonia aquatica]